MGQQPTLYSSSSSTTGIKERLDGHTMKPTYVSQLDAGHFTWLYFLVFSIPSIDNSANKPRHHVTINRPSSHPQNTTVESIIDYSADVDLPQHSHASYSGVPRTANLGKTLACPPNPTVDGKMRALQYIAKKSARNCCHPCPWGCSEKCHSAIQNN